MTVRWSQPPRALRCRATARAVVLASKAMLSPSIDHAPRPAGRCGPCSSGWRRSRTSNALSGRFPAAAIAPPCARIEAALASRPEVLADGHGGDAEPRGQVSDAGAAVLLDEPGDVLLALGCEWGTGLGPGVHRQQPSLMGRCFGLLRQATLDDHLRNVKKVVEIKRNLCHANPCQPDPGRRIGLARVSVAQVSFDFNYLLDIANGGRSNVACRNRSKHLPTRDGRRRWTPGPSPCPIRIRTPAADRPAGPGTRPSPCG